MEAECKIKVHTLLISDIHLRSPNCRAKLLLDTIDGYCFKVLIIVGDLIEDDQVSLDDMEMNLHQFRFIQYLWDRLKSGKTIIRIGGNHDFSGSDAINKILEIETLKGYRWKIKGRKFCAIHGHKFDRFIFKNPWLSKIISCIFLFLQRIDTKKRFFTRMIDGFHNRWFRLTEVVSQAAMKFAHRKGIDVIFCGHTHEAIKLTSAKGNHIVEYFNCGDWTGYNCAFITITKDAIVELHTLPVNKII